MGNCLVKKLNVSADNPYLLKFDEKFLSELQDDMNTINNPVHIKSKSVFTITPIKGDFYMKEDNSASTKLTSADIKSVAVTTTEHNKYIHLYIPGGSIVKMNNFKYLTYLDNGSISTMNVNCCELPQTMRYITGNILNLSERSTNALTNCIIKDPSNNAVAIAGNFEYLTILQILDKKNDIITMSQIGQVISKYINRFTINNGNGISGSVKDLAQALIDRGVAYGSINLRIDAVPVNVTCNGTELNTSNHTLAWDSGTITMDGTPVNS